jgi:uncharacterized phage protein (TIGR02218 family)
MTYSSVETSEADGNPVELYCFARGTSIWRYTSASHDFDTSGMIDEPFDGVYSARYIRRGAVAQSSEPSRNSLSLEVARDLELLAVFRDLSIPGVMAVTVFRLQRLDDEAQITTLWSGRVLGVAWTADGARLECEPSSASLARNALRQLYARRCTHVLYDNLCRALPVPIVTALTAVSGRQIAVTPGTLPAGELAGGWVESLSGDKMAMIVANDAEMATLMMPESFAPGDAVRFYRGCDKTMETCQSRFNNLDNYGGFPFIPQKNPFNAGIF